MEKPNNRIIKRSMSLVLVLALILSLVIAGSAAHWSNHSTIPTATSNTASFQVDTTNHTVTYGQTASWTNESTGEAAVNLSFDGAEYVMKEIKGYDFALIFDGSSSPSESVCKNSAKVFVSNVIQQNPDAQFTVLKCSDLLPVYIQNSNNQAAVNNAITTIPWGDRNCDYVEPGCKKAYDIHRLSGRNTDLMIVIIGDGDWAYMPESWTTSTGMSFTTNYRGDSYSVSAADARREYGTCTYMMETFWWTEDGYRPITYGDYEVTKNGVPVEPTNGQMRATWAKILYFNEFCQKEMRADGVVFATICAPKSIPTLRYNSYAETVAKHPGNIMARYTPDEGYNFEIDSNTDAGFVAAFSELETAITTKVVTMSTTIDNRYFTVDETTLAAGLPEEYTYEIQNTTRGGVAVQDVNIICQMDGEQTLDVSVSIPVTINADIPKADFLEDDHLPVVYDGTAPDGAAGCLFIDLNGTNQNVNTKQVHIDATNFVTGYDDELFEATAENVILRGDWQTESSGYVTFWVSYDGAPITQDHLDALTFTCIPALHWENLNRDFHTKGTAVLTGVTDGIYAQVKVAVDVKVSGVSAVTMELYDVTLATGYVITPGDVAVAYGTINAADSAVMTRVINNMPGTVFPQKGLANNFDHEMMDLTKDGLINAADMSALSRLVNQIAWIRFTP